MAQPGDGVLADRAGVGRQGGGEVVVHADTAGLVPGPSEVHRCPGGGGHGGQGPRDGGAGAQGDEPDLAVVELGQHGLGGELGVEDQ